MTEPYPSVSEPHAARHAASPTPAAIVVVPARFGSTRLPGKPLAEIAGLPMVVRVARRGDAAGCGPVIVATDDRRVIEACEAHGVRAVMTSPHHLSGSDRVHEAVEASGSAAEAVVVLQGDLPLIDPAHLRIALQTLASCDIATLATVINEERERRDPNVVKVIGTPIEGTGTEAGDRLRALYFTRATAPHGEGPLLHHVGLYAYRRDALRRFVGLPPGVLERRESLEQLRALENGMRIDVALVDGQPLGVDAPGDLDRVRGVLAREAEQ